MTITSEHRDSFVVAHLSGSLDVSAGKQFRESADVEARRSDLMVFCSRSTPWAEPMG